MRLALPTIVLSVALATIAAAQAPPPGLAPEGLRPGQPDLTVRAVKLDRPLTLDGILSEAVWQTAAPASRFLQRDPYEGAEATERSEVRIAYDEEALYVGARLYDAHPDSIVARLVRRDFDIASDQFFVFLDPSHDRRSGYYFGVNAAGVLYDGTLFNDGWDDNSWDGVWQGRAHVDSTGWTVEMRIPYSQLRFTRQERCVWGIDFKRVITRKSENDYLVYPPKKESGFASRFPELRGVDGIHPSRAMEIMPYLTGKAEYLVHGAGDPFNDGSRYDPNGGADLRMGVAGKLTLNATVNPDFGQVEVDPAVVNLSDVESFFQEKRPFFVENSRIFNFGNEGASDYWGFNWPEPNFFYSRRIGRAPQGEVPDSAFTDVPAVTHILGAAKLTGKLSPTWSFGTLHALTARERADLFGSGVKSRLEIEPLTYYGIARTQKQFKESRHGLGAMTSLVVRRFDGGGLADQLNRISLQAGLDGWHFLDKKKVYVLSGWAMSSFIDGTPARITAVQEGSRHYFQRPDARSFSVDTTATSLAGYGARVWLNKQSGSVILNSAIGFMNPRFDVNDMGFQTRADVINAHLGTGYAWTSTSPWKKYANVLAAIFQSRDFDNNVVSEGIWAHHEIEFINNYSWNSAWAYNPQTISNRRTRGGPLTLTKPGYQANMYLDTDGKKRWFYFGEVDTYFREDGSKFYGFYPGVEWKPVSSLSLRVGPKYERNLEQAQYVTTVADPLATWTYGNRYILATLDQTTVGAELRANWALSPRLSLQAYVQPLVSTGDYYGFKEVARPRSFDFNHYGQNGSTINESTGDIDPDGPGPAPAFNIGNPDFTDRTLVGNAVMRWEYMPGSTLFVVWTHHRELDDGVGAFDFSRSFDQLGRAQSSNVFLAKLSYYFSR